MPVELSKQELADALPSLRQYFREELEQELSELQARFLIDYFMKELAPFAYNKGVGDAEAYFRAKVDDVSGACFEPGLTYWRQKKRG